MAKIHRRLSRWAAREMAAAAAARAANDAIAQKMAVAAPEVSVYLAQSVMAMNHQRAQWHEMRAMTALATMLVPARRLWLQERAIAARFRRTYLFTGCA